MSRIAKLLSVGCVVAAGILFMCAARNRQGMPRPRPAEKAIALVEGLPRAPLPLASPAPTRAVQGTFANDGAARSAAETSPADTRPEVEKKVAPTGAARVELWRDALSAPDCAARLLALQQLLDGGADGDMQAFASSWTRLDPAQRVLLACWARERPAGRDTVAALARSDGDSRVRTVIGE